MILANRPRSDTEVVDDEHLCAEVRGLAMGWTKSDGQRTVEHLQGTPKALKERETNAIDSMQKEKIIKMKYSNFEKCIF